MTTLSVTEAKVSSVGKDKVDTKLFFQFQHRTNEFPFIPEVKFNYFTQQRINPKVDTA